MDPSRVRLFRTLLYICQNTESSINPASTLNHDHNRACATVSVPRISLFLECRYFLEDSVLAKSPYHIKSSVTPAALKQFDETLQGEPSAVTCANAEDLASLCTEFGFDNMRDAIAKFPSGDADSEGIPARHQEDSQVLLAEFDAMIPIADDHFEMSALSGRVDDSHPMQMLYRMSDPHAIKEITIRHNMSEDLLPELTPMFA
jgi:hypothetical protein